MKKNTKPIVYISELTYDTTVISLEHFPISIAYIIAYAEKYLTGIFNFKQFKFPGHILDAIDSCPPDILAMSCFPWNKNLGLFVAKYYISRKPNGLVVFGGGDFPFERERQVDFFKTNGNVDIFVMHDGELGFLEILKRYINSDFNKKNMLMEGPIDGCVSWDSDQEDIIIGKTIPRPINIDEIPSPYLTGLMDQYFCNQLLTPLIQSTRGCPSPCTYCFAGNKYNSQVRHFSLDRVMSELEYIVRYRKGQVNQALHFSDSNFGMYPNDEKIAEAIALYQKRINFPTYFYVTSGFITGKNKKERVFNVNKRIRSCTACFSVQSTDRNILSNVKRKTTNIRENKKFVRRYHEKEIPIISEIITGLPGETRETHLQTLKDLIDIGIDEISPFTLMFLEGTELNTSSFYDDNHWDKRYRILPRNFGKYHGKICFEIETVGVASKTFSYRDYLFVRGFHGALKMALLNNIVFKEILCYLRLLEVDIFTFFMKFYEALKKDSGKAGEQFRCFLKEAKEEIWDNEEKLKEFFQIEENYQKLLAGEAGENLLNKYKVITICDNFDSICDFYHDQAVKAVKRIKEKGNFQSELSDIIKHIKAKASNIISESNKQGNPVYLKLNYDVLKWQKEKYIRHLSMYRFAKPTEIKYVIKEKGKKLVEEIITFHSKERSDLWKSVSNRYYLPALFREGHII